MDVEATAYIGSGGRTALRVKTAHELLVTNRLILEPPLELDWHGQTDPARAQGSGLADAELGLRLRYEVRREIAPYVGLTRERRFGRTADLARAASRDPGRHATRRRYSSLVLNFVAPAVDYHRAEA